MLENFRQHIDIQLFQQIVFFIFAGITIGGAIFLLLTRNMLYGAYGLLITLLGLSGLYVFAGADFLAVSQIMIYVGGVLILIIFGIMLTNNKSIKRNNLEANRIIIGQHNQFWAILVSIFLFLGFLKLIFEANFHLIGKEFSDKSTIQQIGTLLITDYVIAFEMIGILLLIALIGSVYIAQKQKNKV